VGEAAAVGAVVALPVVLGAPLRLVPVALLWVAVAVVSADANRKHHDGYLEADHPTEYANDSFTPLHTTLGFNIGYHTAHHRRPNAHWSKLAALSAKADAARAEPG
jgi:fatty acid desaturase